MSANGRQQPRKQHLISEVLLGRFTSTHHGARLRSFDLVYGTPKLKHAAAVGWRRDFVEHEPAEIEALWQQTENGMAPALAAVDQGTILDNPPLAAVLRHAIALHFIRRELVKDSFERSFARERANVRVPDDFPGSPAVFRAVIDARLEGEKAPTFVTELRTLFAKARGRADTSHLEVIHSPEVPLLIGDSAVLSFQRDGGVGFIPFADAGTHVLPIGPHHMIALGREDQLLELAPEHAHQLNEQQIVNARRHVFYSPDNDLDPFVTRIRDQYRNKPLPSD